MLPSAKRPQPAERPQRERKVGHSQVMRAASSSTSHPSSWQKIR